MTGRRLVVCCPGGERSLWHLPASDFIVQPWIWGGVRSLHELAFAAAAAGWDVELRGWLDRGLFDQLAAAAGVQPRLQPEIRRPAAGDLVVVPEGHEDPLQFARIWLSDAQLIVMAMGPLGLSGWPFERKWARPSALAAGNADVNQPAAFRAIAAMDVSVWSESPVIAAAARAEGVRAQAIGIGQPMPYPDGPDEKTVDVVWLADSRWSPLAAAVAAKLNASTTLDVSLDRIEAAGHGELLRRLGAARTLLYPARLEGESRVTREARALGTVPVVLTGNPVATQLSEEHGVVSVDTPEAMATAIAALLAEPDRLARLAAAGRASARAEVAWEPFVDRVGTALAAVPEPDLGRGARAAIGDRIGALLDERADARGRAEELAAELDRVRARKDAAESELSAIIARRSVRMTLRAAELLRRSS